MFLTVLSVYYYIPMRRIIYGTYLFLILLGISPCLSAQDFQITTPRLGFDGNTLVISYDIIHDGSSGTFKIMVEILDQSGNPLKTSSARGDVGENISQGNGKTITWTPEKDSVFLDENITVEIKGEIIENKEYEKDFNRGYKLLQSAIVPGWGQAKATGKPVWLISLPAYTALVGAFIMQNSSNKSFSDYYKERNYTVRSELLSRSQRQLTISDALFMSAAIIYAGNLVWMIAMPNKKYFPGHAGLSFRSVPYVSTCIPMATLQVNF